MRTLAKRVAALLLVTAMLAGNAPSILADTDLEIGGLAIVANTGGDSVLIRSGAGYDYLVLTMAAPGDIMTVLDGPFEGADGGLWYEVSYDGTVGYAYADFLVLPENAPLVPDRSPSGGGRRAVASGYASIIGGTGGDGARIRDGADLDAAILNVVPDGDEVSVIGDPISSDGYAWYPIEYAGLTGWIAGIFLDGGSAGPEVTAQTTAPHGGPSFEVGAHVQVSGTGGDDLRLRTDSSLDADILGHAPADAVVEVLDGPYWDAAGNGWYQVDFDGLTGFASAGYLVWTGARLSARQVVAAAPAPTEAAPAPQQRTAPAPVAAPPSNAGRGQTIVNVAMRYLGYPYVWAGASPSGFDCSGFTMYVLDRAHGIGIGHALGGQVAAGVPVSPDSLEPGDLVFFVNTYEPGLSHVGIYIGGGQMVHAGSERTGVVISNIWDSYWGPKFYAARRY